MAALGFKPFLRPEVQAPIIVTFHAPAHPAYDFKRFYEGAKARGFILYPGKLTQVETFRVGCIGAIGRMTRCARRWRGGRRRCARWASTSPPRALGQRRALLPGRVRQRRRLALPVCPRQTLKRVLKRAEKLGFAPMAGMEFEWFNFAETPQSWAAKRAWGPSPSRRACSAIRCCAWVTSAASSTR
jgi:hypothetical protein